MIEVKKIAHSIGEGTPEIASLQLTYPRFVHAEFMTHRVFSRNASSSRAIPVQTMIDNIKANIAYPEYWGKNMPGMQAKEELGEDAIRESRSVWEDAMFDAVLHAERLMRLGNHKQVVNRLLEPFAHISVIVTSTTWANFFELRRHADAQPEIKIVADMMYDVLLNSKPEHLVRNEYHIPYVNINDFDDNVELAVKCSVARCARVSYLTHDGKKPDIEKDLKLYNQLVSSKPLHASPAEHQATPDMLEFYDRGNWENKNLHGNFEGWIQFRKMLEQSVYKTR